MAEVGLAAFAELIGIEHTLSLLKKRSGSSINYGSVAFSELRRSAGLDSGFELRDRLLALHHPYRPFQIRPQDRAVEWRDHRQVRPPQPVMAMHHCHHDELPPARRARAQ